MAGATWGRFSADAPDLAHAARARFAANLHHVLGTIRRDGAPRLSGTEVAIDDARLSVGMMPGSRKLEDVRRDPRVEIHSAPLEEDLSGGDVKVAGRLEEVLDEPGPGVTFTLLLELVSLARVGGNELVITIWRPGRGIEEVRRS